MYIEYFYYIFISTHLYVTVKMPLYAEEVCILYIISCATKKLDPYNKILDYFLIYYLQGKEGQYM